MSDEPIADTEPDVESASVYNRSTRLTAVIGVLLGGLLLFASLDVLCGGRLTGTRP